MYKQVKQIWRTVLRHVNVLHQTVDINRLVQFEALQHGNLSCRKYAIALKMTHTVRRSDLDVPKSDAF